MNKKYAIISNKEKDKNNKVSYLIGNMLKKLENCEIYNLSIGQNELIEDKFIKDADIIFSLGGDGTFLNIARQTSKLGIPILGINLGSLGFLSEVELKDLESSIKKIHSGKYDIVNRLMIHSNIYRSSILKYKDNALNDFVISRGELSRIITLELHINGSYVDSFPGDGLIVSTPTGSTGYALSAGGPVIEHDASLILITPICSHVMHSRSFVISNNSKIEIKLKGNNNTQCLMTVDGQKAYTLTTEDIIKIEVSNIKAKLIKVSDRSFYDVLRKKMYNRER